MGLHAGWAIEGAVGSEFKIDASYISPNVSIAETVTHASEVYGVSFLASDTVVTLCHQECRRHCRVVDRVIIPGSKVPMELYCVDIDPSCLNVGTDTSRAIPWNPRQRFRVRQFLEVEKKGKMAHSFLPYALFQEDKMLAEMQSPFTEDFKQTFKMGYKNYLEGEWLCAKNFLCRTWSSWGFEDGPSRALLHFMELTHFVPPEDWPGFRDLDCSHFAAPWHSSSRRSSVRRSTCGEGVTRLSR
eukprot:UN3458